MKRFALCILVALLVAGCASAEPVTFEYISVVDHAGPAMPAKTVPEFHSGAVRAWNPFDHVYGRALTVREAWAITNAWVTYENDPEGEWKDPIRTFVERAGDCEDINSLFACVLLALGYDAFVVVGDTNLEDDRKIDHAWVGVRRDGAIYWLDATGPPPVPFTWERLRVDTGLFSHWTPRRHAVPKTE